MSIVDRTTKPMARPAVASSGPYVHPQHKSMSTVPSTVGPDASKASASGARTGK